MVKRIAHIGIAVNDLGMAREAYRTLLGLEPSPVERVETQSVDVSSIHVDDTSIELTSGISDDSPIAKFIRKRGEGMHHVAFEVDDIHAELARLRAAGIALIDESPRLGADGYYVAFIHPRAAGGVLVELCQKA